MRSLRDDLERFDLKEIVITPQGGVSLAEASQEAMMLALTNQCEVWFDVNGRHYVAVGEHRKVEVLTSEEYSKKDEQEVEA